MPQRRINRLASAIVLALTLIAGCSSGQTVAPTIKPVAFVAAISATPTPLAIERQVPVSADSSTAPEPTPNATPIAAPKATPKPTAKPTAKPASYFKPAGWDGYSDVDCPDFDTHAHAQSFFKGTGGTTSNDPYRLDRDHDGVACETLP
jgi:hypothetical protein